MARITTAQCRLCRREGEKLFLKGTKCTTDKCAFMRRQYAPGQHGAGRRRKPSNYDIQLREKQKAKRIYGLLEKQFRLYFAKAEKTKGATGEILLQFLEQRLDNVVYRACFSGSRAGARQIVTHRHVKVNGHTVNIPSYLVKPDDEVVLFGTKEQAKALKETAKIFEERNSPEWMEVSEDNLAIKIKRLPGKDDIGVEIEENLIVELYSK